jgi:16S rRNA (cytosine967-C5)-methyltransferase
MCAAPGGKTSHIYQLTRGRAKIYAFDHSSRRIQKMKQTLSRLGVENVNIFRADSRYISIDFRHLEADLVILDPPCTATGIRPKIYDRKTRKDLEALSSYQKQFIYEAYKILKPGGILIYSTCSLTYHENEAHVEEVVDKGLFEPVEPQTRYVPRSIIASGEIPWIRFNPVKHDSPGFFICLLKRVG